MNRILEWPLKQDSLEKSPRLILEFPGENPLSRSVFHYIHYGCFIPLYSPPIPPIRRWSILSIPYIMVLFPHTSLYSHVYVPYILHLFSICHIPPIYLRLVNFPPTFPPSSTPSSSEEGTCEATRSASHGAGGAAIVQGWAQFQGHVQRATGQGREGQFWTFGICPWKNHGRLWFNIFNQQWWSIANQHGTIGQTTWVLWHNLCI